jgi:hypothetical protein
MSHSCPECGQYCCCDMEDHENEEYEDCDHYLTRECRGDEVPEDLRELHAIEGWDGKLVVKFCNDHGIPVNPDMEAGIRRYLIERIAALEHVDAIRKQAQDQVSDCLAGAVELVRRITITEVQRCKHRPSS